MSDPEAYEMTPNEAKGYFGPLIAPLFLEVVKNTEWTALQVQEQAIENADSLRRFFALGATNMDLFPYSNPEDSLPQLEKAAQIPGRLEQITYPFLGVVENAGAVDCVIYERPHDWKYAEDLFSLMSYHRENADLEEQTMGGIGTAVLFHSMLVSDAYRQLEGIDTLSGADRPSAGYELVESKAFTSALLQLSSRMHIQGVGAAIMSNTDLRTEDRDDPKAEAVIELLPQASPIKVESTNGAIGIQPNVATLEDYWDSSDMVFLEKLEQFGCPARLAVRQESGGFDTAISAFSMHQAAFLRRAQAFEKYEAFVAKKAACAIGV